MEAPVEGSERLELVVDPFSDERGSRAQATRKRRDIDAVLMCDLVQSVYRTLFQGGIADRVHVFGQKADHRNLGIRLAQEPWKHRDRAPESIDGPTSGMKR